jgi:hypothetical protein
MVVFAHRVVVGIGIATFACVAACGSNGSSSTSDDAGGGGIISDYDAYFPGVDAQNGSGDSQIVNADASADANGSANDVDASDGGLPSSYPYDGGTLAADRFVTSVVSVTYGMCAGYGQSDMPGVVLGPPVGGGASEGSTNVVSLGNGGEIVLSFAPNSIVDGPGTDFIVFENPFFIGGSMTSVFAEPGEVSVSDDGTTWTVFPCTATAPPYGMCAGWHPVYSSPSNGISPVDPTMAGGDPFDLKDVGVVSAKYVRIRDMTSSTETCPSTNPKPDSNGFDLDAVSIVNAEMP